MKSLLGLNAEPQEYREPVLNVDSDSHISPPSDSTMTAPSYLNLDFSDFEDHFGEDAFVVGGMLEEQPPGDYFCSIGEVEDQLETPVADTRGDVQDLTLVDADDWDDDNTPPPPTHTRPPRRPTSQPPSRPRRRSKKKKKRRLDSLPRSRLRMNISPAGEELKRYAKALIGATCVEHATVAESIVEHEALTSAQELELEPGSRTVTEGEVKTSTGEERKGWLTAAFKEYQESFLDMGAITVSTREEVARAGGPSRALPMKFVWVQKPEKKISGSRLR